MTLKINELMLIRLLAGGRNGMTKGEFTKSLKPLLVDTPFGVQWSQVFNDAITTLIGEGSAQFLSKSRYGVTKNGYKVSAELLGLSELPRRILWPSIKNTYLQAYALGLAAPNSDKERQRIATADGLRAAILSVYYQLPTSNYPTLTEARNALLWKHLAEPGLSERVKERIPALMGRPFTQGAVMELLLNDLLETKRNLPWEASLKQLVAKVTGAKRTDANELRLAILRRALSATKLETPTPFDLSLFAKTVVQVARTTTTGRFGENKIFISHVWERLRTEGQDFGLDERRFKERLAEANNKGLLRLSRADLAQALDQGDVSRSETIYLTATFHFIRTD